VHATLLEIWALRGRGLRHRALRGSVREAREARRDQAADQDPLVADITSTTSWPSFGLEQGVRPAFESREHRRQGFVQEIVNVAKDKRIPIRDRRPTAARSKGPLARTTGHPEGMVESALRHIRILEDLNYPEMKISLRPRSPDDDRATACLPTKVDYPFTSA